MDVRLYPDAIQGGQWFLSTNKGHILVLGSGLIFDILKTSNYVGEDLKTWTRVKGNSLKLDCGMRVPAHVDLVNSSPSVNQRLEQIISLLHC